MVYSHSEREPEVGCQTSASVHLLRTLDAQADAGEELAFRRQVVGVIAAVNMDVKQCEAVISQDASVIVDAEGKIAEHHAIHRVLFAVEAVYVSGCEKERCTGLEDA